MLFASRFPWIRSLYNDQYKLGSVFIIEKNKKNFNGDWQSFVIIISIELWIMNDGWKEDEQTIPLLPPLKKEQSQYLLFKLIYEMQKMTIRDGKQRLTVDRCRWNGFKPWAGAEMSKWCWTRVYLCKDRPAQPTHPKKYSYICIYLIDADVFQWAFGSPPENWAIRHKSQILRVAA